jgi:hypothetical protein
MSYNEYSEGTVLQSDSTRTTTTYTKKSVFHSETTTREETRMIIAVLRTDGLVAVLRELVANFPTMLLAQPGDKVKWRYLGSSLSEFQIDFTARKPCAK